MKNFDIELDKDFTKTLEDFAKLFSDTINEKLVTYYNDLSLIGISKDEMFLKVIQKSNELVFKDVASFSTLFSISNDEDKEEITKRLKILIAPDF